MSEPIPHDQVWRELLLEGLEDLHGLWWIVGYFNHIADPAQKRLETLELVRELLESGFFEAGLPTRDSAFEPWDLSPADAVARIEREWVALGKEPTLGDIVWLNLTEHGEREAKRIRGSQSGGAAQHVAPADSLVGFASSLAAELSDVRRPLRP